MKHIKFKKGDEVKVMSGKDKGKTGKIEKIFIKEDKVLVGGVNQYKRHLKARSQSQPSEIITLTKPLRVSVVSLICPRCQKVTRVGFKLEKDAKIRICKKCKSQI
jgi:large subunit ribosomal protein L24